MILSEGDNLTPDLLPLDFELAQKGVAAGIFNLKVEKSHISKVLDYVKGNKTKAAAILGIGLITLYRKLDEYRVLNKHFINEFSRKV